MVFLYLKIASQRKLWVPKWYFSCRIEERDCCHFSILIYRACITAGNLLNSSMQEYSLFISSFMHTVRAGVKEWICTAGREVLKQGLPLPFCWWINALFSGLALGDKIMNNELFCEVIYQWHKNVKRRQAGWTCGFNDMRRAAKMFCRLDI